MRLTQNEKDCLSLAFGAGLVCGMVLMIFVRMVMGL